MAVNTSVPVPTTTDAVVVDDVIPVTTLIPEPEIPLANEMFKHFVPSTRLPVTPIFVVFSSTLLMTFVGVILLITETLVLDEVTVGKLPPVNDGLLYVTPVTVSFASDVTVAVVPENVGCVTVPAGV